MLDKAIIKQIEDLVYLKPRSIQEIAKHINKNWRTADRYIEDIEKEFGTISSRTFREGTRGALKIAYWASIEKAQSNIFQNKLEKEIELFKRKEDFSSFDIYQHIEDKNKSISLSKTDDESEAELVNLKDFISKTKNQLLIFSGNLSFVNLKTKELDIFKTIEDLVKSKVSIKIVCRVDYISYKTIERILSLNYKYGGEYIQIHHSEQPVRGMIRDNKEIRLKEIKEPTGKIDELNKKVYIYYKINDSEWASWLSKVFWKNFSNSIDAKKRMEDLEKYLF